MKDDFHTIDNDEHLQDITGGSARAVAARIGLGGTIGSLAGMGIGGVVDGPKSKNRTKVAVEKKMKKGALIGVGAGVGAVGLGEAARKGISHLRRVR
jgi:hypothetical protein